MQTFSVIIPTYNRAKTIGRALKSLANQSYPLELIQVIVINDGSTDKTEEELFQHLDAFPHTVVKCFPTNKGRLAARNEGVRQATNDWICWLDSDDEYASNYFEVLNAAINKNPGYAIFNFGAVVYDEQSFRSYLRHTFVPGVRPDGIGHDVFKSGRIGSGSFIFKRGILGEIGDLPEAATPYGDDASLPALASAKWPDIMELYGKNESGQWLPFGNPWGDDWLMFYLLTRNHLSKSLDIHLYIQHIRH